MHPDYLPTIMSRTRKIIIPNVVTSLLILMIAGTTTSWAMNLYWDANESAAGTGNTGVWDQASALWRSGSATGPLQAWDNVNPSTNTAYFGGVKGKITIAPGLTVYANGLFFDTVDGHSLEGGNSESILALTGLNPLIGGNKNAVINSKINVGSGVTFNINGQGLSLNNPAGNQLSGSGPVTLTHSSYGFNLVLNYSQSAFTGGFRLLNSMKRQVTLYGNVVESLGTGLTALSGHSRLVNAWGAQAAGGAADGGPSGLVSSNASLIDLSGTWSSSKDRFMINDGGALRGGSNQLGAVSRVSAFTAYPGATRPEVIFGAGGAIIHTETGTNSVMNLGANADVLFGLGSDFNSPLFTLRIGTGSPWCGLFKESSANGDTLNRRFQKGTVTLDNGGGSFTQMVIRSSGQDYSNLDQIFYLGNGSDCPVFETVSGGGKVAARILRTIGYGEVVLDSTNPQFSGGIKKFIVGGDGLGGGELVVNRASGLGGVPVEVDVGGLVRTTVADGFDGNVTVLSNGVLLADRLLNGSGSLLVGANGIVSLQATNGLVGVQGASNVQTGAIVQFVLSDPAKLGETQPGAILEYLGYRSSKGHTMGGFIANGQILTRSPENYNAQEGFIGNSVSDGISGTLTICSPSSGAYPGVFEIQENFETGTELTIGLTNRDQTVRGYYQRGNVMLNNANNDMSMIQVAGAGANGATVLVSPAVGCLGTADVVFVVSMADDPGGSRVDFGGDKTTDVTYPNSWTVNPGCYGKLLNSIYQGTRTLTLSNLMVRTGGRLEMARGGSCKYAIGGTIVVASNAVLDVLLSGGSFVIPNGSMLSGNGTIQGNVVMTNGSSLAWTVGDPDVGTLTVTNTTLTFSGAQSLKFYKTAKSNPQPSMIYPLFNYKTLAGFDPANWTIDYGSSGWSGGVISNDTVQKQIVLLGVKGLSPGTLMIVR